MNIDSDKELRDLIRKAVHTEPSKDFSSNFLKELNREKEYSNKTISPTVAPLISYKTLFLSFAAIMALLAGSTILVFALSGNVPLIKASAIRFDFIRIATMKISEFFGMISPDITALIMLCFIAVPAYSEYLSISKSAKNRTS